MNTTTQDRPAGRDLAHRNGGTIAQPDGEPSQSQQRLSQTLQMVREAMLNPDVDANKARVMADLMTSLEDRALVAEFNRAKNAAIMEMPVISKESEIIINDKLGNFLRKQGKFARFEDIERVCRPILQRHGLAMGFDIAERESGGLLVTTILTHQNGHTERGGGFPVPPDTSGGKNAAQAFGSSAQYGKRYAYCAALNIVTEGVDDDGNMGGFVASLPYEREQLVRAEAQLASEQGAYQEWFDHQPPKDRAWMVSVGLHEQYGGRALPAPARPEPPAPPASAGQDERRPPKPTPTPTQEKKRAQTPREWADLVKAELDKCLDLDRLDEFWDGKRTLLDRLNGTDHALWQELDDAYKARREAIEEGRLV